MVEGVLNSLHEAARKGDVEAVREILSVNAESLNDRDRHSRTPLHLAAWAGREDVVRVLCDASADVGAAAMDDMSAIHFASQKGHYEVVRILLAAGAYVNAKNRKGMTPLHFAVQGSKEDLIKLLVKKGANLSSDNKNGKSPIDLARDESFRALIKEAELERNARRAKNKEKPSLVVREEVREVGEESQEARPITVAERPITVPDRQNEKAVEKCKSPFGDVEPRTEVELESNNEAKRNKLTEPKRKKAKVSLSHLSFDDGNEEEMAL